MNRTSGSNNLGELRRACGQTPKDILSLRDHIPSFLTAKEYRFSSIFVKQEVRMFSLFKRFSETSPSPPGSKVMSKGKVCVYPPR